MVAVVQKTKKRTKIYKGESPVEEIQKAFKEEMDDIMKDASMRMHCPVEQLKVRFDAEGGIEVQKMTLEEMKKMQELEVIESRVRKIRSRNG